jgi:hypothetical protein
VSSAGRPSGRGRAGEASGPCSPALELQDGFLPSSVLGGGPPCPVPRGREERGRSAGEEGAGERQGGGARWGDEDRWWSDKRRGEADVWVPLESSWDKVEI